MRLQIAFDMMPLEKIVEQVQCLGDVADIIEIGTSICLRYGMTAVNTIKSHFPHITVLADIKIMDGGGELAGLAVDAGADIITVMAAANDATIEQAVRTAHMAGREVMADMMAVQNIETRALQMGVLGVDYVCIHTAHDVQDQREPFAEVAALRRLGLGPKLAVAGGLRIHTMPLAMQYQPEVLIVGGAIINADDPMAAAKEFNKMISGYKSIQNLDITAIGEAVIDFTPVGHAPSGNALYERQPGGAPANMLTQAARLGLRTAQNGLVGDDPFGHFLVKMLQHNGIQTGGMILSRQMPTHTAILDYDENGDRSFFSIQTESSLYAYRAADVRYDLIERCKILHISGAFLSREGPLEAVKKAVEYARNNQKLISCDMNWRPFMYDRAYAQSTMLPVLCRMDVLKLSEKEFELLTNTDDLDAGSKKLMEMGVRLIVVTMGAKGCYYCYTGGMGRLDTYDVKVVDTNASGDAFTGAMLSRLMEYSLDLEKIPDAKMRDVMDFANAAGALCASKHGAIHAIPSREEIDACRMAVPLMHEGRD